MPMLSQIEITIDFNGPEAKLYHSNTQKQNGESFSNFTESFQIREQTGQLNRLFHTFADLVNRGCNAADH